jgi:hypothetical protein
MTLIGQNQLLPMTQPAQYFDAATMQSVLPIQVRANDNNIVGAFNAHDASGTIHNQSSVLASRPAFGVTGRVWYVTDGSPANRVYIDTGAAWAEIPYMLSSAGPFLPLAGGTMVGTVLFSADNIWNIGAVGATRPANVYVGTLLTSPTGTFTTALVLTGATVTGTPVWSSSQAITLSTAAQPNITSLGTLAANLLFVDNTYDIGAVATTRPRSGYFGTNLTAGGNILAPTSGLQTWFVAGTVPSSISTAFASVVVFGSNVTARGAGFFISNTVPASTAAGIVDGIYVANTTLNAGATIATQVGVEIANQTSGTANYTIRAGTGIAQLDGQLRWNTDNTYDIGAVGATRPRTVYVGTSVVVPTVTATTLTGTLSTAVQTSITSVGTLTVLAVSGIATYTNIIKTLAGETAIQSGNMKLGGSAQVNGNAVGFNIVTLAGAFQYRIVISGKDASDGSAPANTFLDVVVLNAGAAWVPITVSSTTVKGAPGARTYSNNIGVLKIVIASGTTWYIDSIVTRFGG